MDMNSQKTAHLFGELLRSVKGVFTAEERREIRHLIARGQNKLALLRVIDLALMDGKTIGAASFTLISTLFAVMASPQGTANRRVPERTPETV